MQDREELNLELHRRIRDLASPPDSESELFASMRPVLLEALIWVVGSMLLWAAVVILY